MAEFSMTKSRQWDCIRMDFHVPGGRAFVILPGRPARTKNIPWIWYAPTFVGSQNALPKELHRWYMEQWLADGIAIGGVDVGESWGNQAGRMAFTEFHEIVVREFSLDFKACLMPQSRGALMLYNWAVEHPDRVSCIGAIYPVCSIYEPRLAERILLTHGLTQRQLEAEPLLHNPVDRLEPLAKAKVPIFHIHGDVDELVPLSRHSRMLIDRYCGMGGPGELLVMRGKGHEEVAEFFQCPALRDFIRWHALA